MMDILTEPGFFVLVGLLAIAAVNIASSWKARGLISELEALFAEIRQDPNYSSKDEKWLAHLLHEAKGRSIVYLATISPLLIVTAPWAAIAAARSLKDNGGADILESTYIDISRIQAAMIKDETGSDVRDLALWSDPRKDEIEDRVQSLQMLRYPIATAIILIVALPGFLIMFAIMAGISAGFRNILKFAVKHLVKLEPTRLFSHTRA